MLHKLLFITLIAVAACGDDTPTAPTRDSLDGVWRIISIQPATQAVQTAPVGAQYQVGFENGRVFLRVDCNTCTGPFTVTGSTLTLVQHSPARARGARPRHMRTRWCRC